MANFVTNHGLSYFSLKPTEDDNQQKKMADKDQRKRSQSLDVTRFWEVPNKEELGWRYGVSPNRGCDLSLSNEELNMFDSTRLSYLSAKMALGKTARDTDHGSVKPQESNSGDAFASFAQSNRFTPGKLDSLEKYYNPPRPRTNSRDSGISSMYYADGNTGGRGRVHSSSRSRSPIRNTPYEHIQHRRVSPINTRTRHYRNPNDSSSSSSGYDSHPSMPNQYQARKYSMPDDYKNPDIDERHTVSVNPERSSRPGGQRVPGDANHNWLMRKRSSSHPSVVGNMISRFSEEEKQRAPPKPRPPIPVPRVKKISSSDNIERNSDLEGRNAQNDGIKQPLRHEPYLHNHKPRDTISPSPTPSDSKTSYEYADYTDNLSLEDDERRGLRLDESPRPSRRQENYNRDASFFEEPANRDGYSGNKHLDIDLGNFESDYDIPRRRSEAINPSIADTSISRNTTSFFPLTVENPPVKSASEEQNQEVCNNFFVVTAKWIAVILVALIVLACVTSNKICILVIGHEYHILMLNPNASTTNQTDYTDRSKFSSKESIVIMLVIILMVPQLISFLYAIWGRRESHKWPRRSAVLLIIIGGTVEVFCLSYLCLFVPTVISMKPDLYLLALSGMFLVPTIIQMYESSRKWKTKKGKVRMCVFTIATGLQIAGLSLLIYNDRVPGVESKIGILVAIGILSIAWSPKVRKLQTKPMVQYENPAPTSASSINNLSNADSTDNDAYSSASLNRTLDSQFNIPGKPKKLAAREKATLIMSFVHIVITPIACTLLCHVYHIADLNKLGSGFSQITSLHPAFYYFLVQLFVTFIGYHMAWLACSMYAQQIAFALPLTLATPLALVFIEFKSICESSLIPLKCGPQEGSDLYYLIGIGVLMLLGQFLSTGYYVWANKGYIMGNASHLFWMPSYTGVLLEPFLLLNRRNKVTDDSHVTSKHLARDTYVFTCSTMYHEELHEMEQLLESLHDIDVNFKRAGRHVESHIFFDGCIKAEVMNSYVLQLASIVESTLNVPLALAIKVLTPYGMQLQWKLPGGLPITIHLKDNTKVKNKKRWSQVMYMSYILDYKQRILKVRDDQTFILTTDADVKFNHDSMEALLDYMMQDDKIGAVCGRTHPMGNGPMVWYQIFDYAIGHWFMKVANHMLGSVLCCPGCFSLYRCQAVRDILPTYSTTVVEAFEFLTKDMGEDRWMCTLMVQAGWRLTYCAAAEDMTYCPQEFGEFYKQRRRWIPSTLANLSLLISEWRVVLKNNENVSFPFIVYQVILLLATIIGPSIVILFIVGGLVNMGVDETVSTTLLAIVTIGYALICLFFSQDIQITVAKFLTFCFAIIMIIVTIGLALQISVEINDRKALKANGTVDIPLDKQLPAGVSTLYLGGLAGIFVLAAFMHPKEILCLFNGIWYLLCLPSGYLLLTVYSVVNMTDRSWGTREGKNAKTGQDANPLAALWKIFKVRCGCCLKPFKLCEDSSVDKPRKPSQFKDKLSRIGSQFSRKSRRESASSSVAQKRNRIKRKRERREQQVESDTDIESSDTGSRSSTWNKLRVRIRQSVKGLDFWNRSSTADQSVDVRDPQFSGRNGQVFDSRGNPVVRISPARSNLAIEYEPDHVEPSDAFGILTERDNRGFQYERYPRPTPPLPPPRRKVGLGVNSLGYPMVHQRGNEETPYNDQDISPVPSIDRLKNSDSGHDTGYDSLTAQQITQLASSDIEKRARRPSAHILNVNDPNDDRSYYGTEMSENQITVHDIDMTVEEWLRGDMRVYIDNFKKYGYDNISFLAGMTEKNMEAIGIKVQGHRQKLARLVHKLPKIEIEEGIPTSVRDWLLEISLVQYWEKFVQNAYLEPSDLEGLKDMSKDVIKETFNVKKIAHLNRLCQAVQKLQYTNLGQKKIRKARAILNNLPTYNLELFNEDDGAEYDFWENLRHACLLPELAGFDGNTELKTKLADLRNSVLMVFFIVNALWMVVIMFLVKQSDLKTLGVDVIGLSFLFLYGTVIILQFLSMIAHRLTTLLHVLARAPYICCFPTTRNE